MKLEDFLRRRGTDLADVVGKVSQATGLAKGDVLFVCGSLVEGIGNDKSDVDLFLITSRPGIAFSSLTDIVLLAGTAVVDIRVVERAAVERLLHRFANWAAQPRNERSAMQFTDDERKLLHRICVGCVVHGEEDFNVLREQVVSRDLARHKLDIARYVALTIQVDMAGLRSDGDRNSLFFASQELLDHTIDALLAGHGNTDPSWKWRSRRLAALPPSWETELPGRVSGMAACDLYLLLHRAPLSCTASAVLEHAQRIAAFSRRVFAWAECRLLTAKPPRLIPLTTTGRSGPGSLRHLDLDVVIKYEQEHFVMKRVNGTGQTYRLSADEYALLCLVDGETTMEEAAAHSRRLFGGRGGRDALRSLLAIIEFGDLGERPLVDEELLARILRG